MELVKAIKLEATKNQSQRMRDGNEMKGEGCYDINEVGTKYHKVSPKSETRAI